MWSLSIVHYLLKVNQLRYYFKVIFNVFIYIFEKLMNSFIFVFMVFFTTIFLWNFLLIDTSPDRFVALIPGAQWDKYKFGDYDVVFIIFDIFFQPKFMAFIYQWFIVDYFLFLLSYCKTRFVTFEINIVWPRIPKLFFNDEELSIFLRKFIMYGLFNIIVEIKNSQDCVSFLDNIGWLKPYHSNKPIFYNLIQSKIEITQSSLICELLLVQSIFTRTKMCWLQLKHLDEFIQLCSSYLFWKMREDIK